MNRNHLQGALLIAAASLLTTGAHAQNSHAAPQAKANAAEKAGDKAEKAADKADKAVDKAKSVEDRVARKAKEHDAQREKLKTVLKGPIDEATKQELRRHAERLARLDRIKAVAQTEKDTPTSDKATALVTKENDRHEKWMSKHATEATPTVAVDPKGGAK